MNEFGKSFHSKTNGRQNIERKEEKHFLSKQVDMNSEDASHALKKAFLLALSSLQKIYWL